MQLKMSEEQVCILCCTTCREYKCLQNNFEEWNEAYYITVKYFDPKLLKQIESTTSQPNAVLCQDCWFNINEFHEFQQNVLKTRMKWEQTSESETLHVEVKEEGENIFVSNETDNGSLDKSSELEYKLEDVDFSTKSLTRFQDALELLHKQTSENVQGNCLHLDDNKNEGTIQKNMASIKGKENNSLEYNTEYGDLNTGSLVKSRASLDSLSKQTHETYEENIFSLDNNVHGDENNLTTKRISEHRLTKPTEEPKSSECTEVTKTRDSCINKATPKELDEVIANWRSELTCDLCHETCKNFYKLSNHFKVKHKTSGYAKCCDRKFYRRCLLASHIETHLDPEICKCDICGRSFKTKETLKMHKKCVHEDTTLLQCEFCMKLFNQKRTLDRHLLTHSTTKEFICSECGKGYATAPILKLHKKYVHTARVCNQCGKTIRGYHAFRNHLMQHPDHDGTTIYVCTVCGKVATNENAILDHKKLVHEVKRNLKCRYCDKCFIRPRDLREHIATHTGEDPNQCPHCPQKFKGTPSIYMHCKKKHPVEWEEDRRNNRKYN